MSLVDGTTRVQLNLSDRSMTHLEDVMRMSGYRKYAEAFRSALKVYRYILMEVRKGGEFQIVKEDGKVETIKLFLDEEG
jgi:hypothetical protein